MKRILLVITLIVGLMMGGLVVSSLNDRASPNLAIAPAETTILQKEKSDQDGDGDEDEQSVAQLERLFEPIIFDGAKG